jgi:cellulose synthase/poly-beta-1,6-N-acetylglucosamine synthase-like glycosyltransferase
MEVEIILVEGAGAQKLTTSLRLNRATRVVQAPGPGAALARNTGLAAARGQWVALVDSDTILADDWLTTLLEIVRLHRSAGGQARILTTAASADTVFARFRNLQNAFDERGMLNAKFFIPVLNTAACIYDRGQLGDLSFRTDLFAVEDMELSWRLLLRNKVSWCYTLKTSATCFYEPESILHFCRRNFRIGQCYVELFRALPRVFARRDRQEADLVRSWMWKECQKARSTLDLAQWGRALSALAFWLGTVRGHRALAQLPAPVAGQRHIYYDDHFERLEMLTGARWTIRGYSHE